MTAFSQTDKFFVQGRRAAAAMRIRAYDQKSRDALAQYREPALTGQPVQRSLHDPAHMLVDLAYVGFGTEPCSDVDGLQHFHNDL